MAHRTGFIFSIRLLLIVCIFGTFSGGALAAESKGKVEESTPGFWVMREDKRIDLGIDDDIYEFDIVMTDATGAGTIRFIDDTVLEVRNSTELDIKEVVFTEERNRFNVGVMEGTARVITGAIVRQNPRGFKVTTPNSTIGIRGTDLTAVHDGVSGTTGLDVTETEDTVTYTDRLTGISVTVGRGVSVTCDASGQMSVQIGDLNVSFNVNNMAEVAAAATALEGVADVTDSTGASMGTGSSDGSDGGDSSSSSGGNEGSSSSGSSGGSGNGSSGGGDCNDNNSSPGQ